MKPVSFLLLSALLLAASVLHAEPKRYELDPVHSRLVFFVDHAGFSDAIGTFAGLQGELWFDHRSWDGARVEATVPIASLDLGDAEWRERILDPTFFDVRDHPEARFVSTRVEPVDAQHARVVGDLSLLGQTREVVLEVEYNQRKRHPLTFRSTAGFSARVSLSRSAFGMKKWKNLVGDEVEIRIEIEARRDRTPDEPDEEDD